jgi:paraquat-inducible protein B
MADRVTAQEARVVQRLEDIQEVLTPLKALFGEDKAEQIEKFLLMQARLGILRKTLDKLPDEKMRQAVESQMAGLRLEMDKTRRAVGSYCMASVRALFPSETSPFLARLQTVMQERTQAGQSPAEAAAQWQRLDDLFKPHSPSQPGATGGAGWMSNLGQRTSKPPSSQRPKS